MSDYLKDVIVGTFLRIGGKEDFFDLKVVKILKNYFLLEDGTKAKKTEIGIRYKKIKQ